MIEFYKPKPNVKGSACRFYLNEQDNSFFSSIIKQKSWDAAKKRSSFHTEDVSKKVNVKFSRKEICNIIHALKTNSEFSGYHGSNQIVKFKFGPYERDGKQLGFSFGVNKESKEDSTIKEFFAIGFDFPEMEMLKIFLEYIVRLSFENERKARIKAAAKKKKEAESLEGKTAVAATAAEPKKENEEKPPSKNDDSDIW